MSFIKKGDIHTVHDFMETGTHGGMIVDNPACLQRGVNRDASDMTKTFLFEFGAYRIGKAVFWGKLMGMAFVYQHTAIGKTP